MGEKQHQPFQLSFNTSLKVELQGSCGPFQGRRTQRGLASALEPLQSEAVELMLRRKLA